MGASISNYHQVKLHPSCRLSPYGSICGDVTMGPNTTLFAGAHVRGDCEPIVVGAGSNIQENACLHVSVGSPLTVGADVTIGHGAILHGCTIRDNVLIGMGSTVMDDAVIESDSVVAAGALVTQGKRFPPRSLIMGSPARAVRELTDEEIEAMITVAAPAYREVSTNMMADGVMLAPPVGATVWPTPGAFGSPVGAGMFVGGMF